MEFAFYVYLTHKIRKRGVEIMLEQVLNNALIKVEVILQQFKANDLGNYIPGQRLLRH